MADRLHSYYFEAPADVLWGCCGICLQQANGLAVKCCLQRERTTCKPTLVKVVLSAHVTTAVCAA